LKELPGNNPNYSVINAVIDNFASENVSRGSCYQNHLNHDFYHDPFIQQPV
jgi:hypothetical protein